MLKVYKISIPVVSKTLSINVDMKTLNKIHLKPLYSQKKLSFQNNGFPTLSMHQLQMLVPNQCVVAGAVVPARTPPHAHLR